MWEMKKVMLSIAIVFAMQDVRSQQDISSAVPGLNAYDKLDPDVFSFIQNQSALANLKSIQAGIYSERIFLMPELANYLLAAAVPLQIGNIGFIVSKFGGGVYSQTTIGLACARRLSEKIDIGVQFNYRSLAISGYGNSSTPGVELASIFHVSEKFRVGLQLKNPVGGKFGVANSEKYPSVISMGMGYRPSTGLFMTSILIKPENQPLNLKAGLKYSFHSRMSLLAGINSSSGQYWFGTTFKLSQLSITLSSTFHSRLGTTPGLMLTYHTVEEQNQIK